MSRISICSLYLSLAWLCLSASAKANVIISFTPDGSLGTFQVTVGDMIGVPIYLSGDSRLSTQGLYSAGATVQYGYESGVGDSTTGNASIVGAELAPHWTNTGLNYVEISNAPADQFAIIEGVVNGPEISPTTPAANTSYILLGTVLFQSGLEGNVTQLSLSNDRNLAFINLLYDTNIGVPLDGQISYVGGKILTVTATPEPTSLIAGVVAAGFGLRALKRRKKKSV